MNVNRIFICILKYTSIASANLLIKRILSFNDDDDDDDGNDNDNTIRVRQSFLIY